jgi:C1A family cysteine protease
VTKIIARTALLGTVLFLALAGPAGPQDGTEPPPATGLIALDAGQLERIAAEWPRITRVGLNFLGFERVNKVRQERGKPGLDPVSVRPVGDEVEGALAGRAASLLAATANLELAGDLPVSVDNSVLRFFPPIRNQGSLGSCASFASTYYQLSYMTAFQRNLDIRNPADNTNKYSPKWTYNMANDGKNEGSNFYDNFSILEKHGAATWADFPYDNNFLAWSLNPAVWRSALGARTRITQYIFDASADLGLEQIKELLINGYVVVYGTYISSWNFQPIKDDPATTDDDAAVNKSVCYWLNGTEGGHAMTVVGYNDAIWTDVNSNGLVDPGEKGAFRIANSWGTGWAPGGLGDGGFTWLAYDALRQTSAVAGGPSVGRVQAFQSDMVFVLTARNSYSPLIIGEFSVSHLKRSQLRLSLGRSNTSASVPSTTWNPTMVRNQGGAFAFDGSTTAVSGTFVLDFTDILAAGAGMQRYYLGLNDNTADDPASLSAFKIVDLTTEPDTETVSSLVPQTADSQQIYAYVDYDYPGPAYNDPPLLSSAQVSPASGQAGATYTFSVRYYDQDGDVPTVKNVIVDGGVHAMSLRSGQAAANGWYDFAMTLAAGSHGHHFYFEDGKGESARAPLAGDAAGPAAYGLLATSLAPSSAVAGDPGFTLGVNGTDFASGAVVTWDGGDRPTTFVSSSRVNAQIADTDIALGRALPVSVRNPGGLLSNAVTFTVNNPRPALTSVSPTAMSGGANAAVLTVRGTGFVPNAVVQWNGTDRITTYVDATELRASLTAQDLSNGGEFVVTVHNPTPGGGASTGVSFIVSDFTMTATPQGLSAAAGQSANCALQVTPQFGSFDSVVSFSATGLPRGCTATFSPQTATPGAAAATTTLTLKTTARSSALAAAAAGRGSWLPPALGIALLFAAFGFGPIVRRAAVQGPMRRRLAAVALILLMVSIAGCSAGGGGGSETGGTPAGTYNIGVHATSGGLSVLTMVTLVVS